MALFSRAKSRRGSTSPRPSVARLEEGSAAAVRFADPLTLPGSLDHFDYFGDPRTLVREEDGIRIGVPPESDGTWTPQGEKLVLRGREYDDVEVSVDVAPNPTRGFDAGILFRVSDSAIGFDQQRGYFAGVILSENRIIMGKTDGSTWTELNRVVTRSPLPAGCRLMLRAIGPQFLLHLDGRPVLAARDAQHRTGSVGLRVVRTDAVFANLEANPLPRPERP